MQDSKQSVPVISQEPELQHQPLYQKPITSSFLLKATDIQSGSSDVLESQGSGYLSS